MTRPRLGIVNAGDGGSAGSYIFVNGLSADPRLAPYLQDLTPAQLQTALQGGAPSLADMGITDQTILTTCQQNYDPTICGPGGPSTTSPLSMSLGLPALSAIPLWGWVIGAGALAALVLVPRRR